MSDVNVVASYKMSLLRMTPCCEECRNKEQTCTGKQANKEQTEGELQKAEADFKIGRFESIVGLRTPAN